MTLWIEAEKDEYCFRCDRPYCGSCWQHEMDWDEDEEKLYCKNKETCTKKPS